MDISSLRERKSGGVFTVGELGAYIKGLLESDRLLSAVTVKGEISNFVYHRSGHLYFTLKDEEGQIKCVMFRSSAQRLKFMPENGMKVTAFGSVNMYTKDGSVQLYVTQLQPDGVGALYKAYEQLKERLYREGLFDQSAKKPIPRLPRRIGVITSPTGAAIRDILNVLGRRYPLATVYLYPSLVQGDDAPANLIRAVDYFDRSGIVDVVIVGRGGGSLEDLWAFNSEDLARRIYSATVPIISAVGHETDFTICDFVSDLRAPTPSAAAEIAVPDTRELAQSIDGLADSAERALLRLLESKRHALAILGERTVIKHPEVLIEERQKRITDLERSAKDALERRVIRLKGEFLPLAKKLDALSPLATLARGYSVVSSEGRVVKSVRELAVDTQISIRFCDGEADARITGKG